MQKSKHAEKQRTFPDELPWLTSDIRVKIVDKKMQNGALYLKKGIVVDVLQPLVCDLVVDGKRISNVHQSQLETVSSSYHCASDVMMEFHARLFSGLNFDYPNKFLHNIDILHNYFDG